MRFFIFLTILLFHYTFLFGQSNNKRNHKTILDTSLVESIVIKGGYSGEFKNVNLNRDKIKVFVDKWNTADTIFTIKPMNAFRIEIKLKNKRKKIIICGAEKILSEDGKNWYNFDDYHFIDKLCEIK